MKIWMKIDLLARALMLLAVAWQLMALGVFVAERQRGDVYQIMENQAYIALMIHALAGSGSHSEIANDVADAQNNITLFSEWDKNAWNRHIRIANIVFVVLFLLGGTLSVVARHGELKDKL
jgi:hypothetical protein